MNANATGALTGIIEGARLSDLTSIRWLLDLHSLPSADITETALESFLVYRDDIGVIGVVGLERYEDVALLRSLVVADRYLRRGLGRCLIAAAEEMAKKFNIGAIYLLTTTAELYFEALGFRYIQRESAPLSIQHCSQFKSLCPSTAVLMVKP